MRLMADLTWRKAVLKALTDLGGEAHYAEIAQEIIDRGYRAPDNIGATPANTVAANISMHLKDKVERVKPGRYRLIESVSLASNVLAPGHEGEQRLDQPATDDSSEAEDMGLINAFGMFWRRSEVSWKGKGTRLLGVQQPGAKPTDFARQAGVYILYDGNRPVYVGRMTADRLGARLAEHTRDRLSARWDRFSWFGVRPVDSEGALGQKPEAGISVDILIATMEALLIEGLEPPQNRRQGDGFNAVEFIQETDPAVKARHKKALVADLLASLETA